MRTTLKRRIGRWEQATGNGRSAVRPPLPRRVSHYQQPAADGRLLRIFGRLTLSALFAAAVLVGGAAGGAYLWAHESVGKTAAHSKDVKKSQQYLDKIPSADQPVIALVVGYDRRAGMVGDSGRSDTIMLIRADPRDEKKSISLLSFPRDQRVPLYCEPDYPYGTGKINSAYASCGAKGTLLTVKALTGLPINYAVTVNFRGFKQIVAKIGGVWIDVDRRYYVSEAESYATIDLQPGYQRLNGSDALDYVRYRHGDSDFMRIERQQTFMRSLREQMTDLSLDDYVRIINVISENVEVGNKKGGSIPLDTLLGYVNLVRGLPNGGFIQTKVDDVSQTGSSDLIASTTEIEDAVSRFVDPDLTAAERAANQNNVTKTKRKADAAPEPSDTTVLVLNASEVEGLARETSYQLALREYQTLEPAGGVKANFPGANLWHSIVYYDRSQPRAKAAAEKLAQMVDTTTVRPIGQKIARLANGAMVVVALGETFDAELPPITRKEEIPEKQPPRVKVDPGMTEGALRSLQKKFGFRLYVPTRIESSSYIDSSTPRTYTLKKGESTLRLTFKMPGYNTGYWGIQEMKWDDAPALDGTHYTRRIAGREYDFYYQGAKLHMVVLKARGASYWVVNTLENQLSNETMIAIAKGLRPIGAS